MVDQPLHIPEDIIAPRILIPGGMLLFAGAPKVGKSDFLLSMFIHFAAGEEFLDMKPQKPHRIFYLQMEIQGYYVGERIANLSVSYDLKQRAGENLFITPRLKMLLNADGVKACVRHICERFGKKRSHHSKWCCACSISSRSDYVATHAISTALPTPQAMPPYLLNWFRIKEVYLMADKNWTVTDIADRFEEAVATMRRLPPVRVQGYFSAWPPIVRTVWEQMAADKLPLRLGPPPADAISRMEETFDWVFWLEEEERKIIWLRASKVRWKQIQWKMGYGKTKTREIWTIGLLKITYRLNGENRRKK